MTVKTGSAWAGTFVTLDATGALATPSSGPAGVLYVDGTANAATVTITGSNPYKWSVTLPSLTAGQRVDMYITATIATIATAGFVASAQADTALLSDGVVVNSGTVTTVTNLTNLPAVPTDWLTAAGIKADAVTKIQAGLAPSSDLTVVSGYVDELETRLTAARAGYLDKLNVSGTLAHSDAAATYKADVSGLMTAGAYVAPDNATIASISSTLGTGVALTAAGVDAILDEVVVGSYTMRQLLKVFAAKMVGKGTGGGTTTITYRGVDDASNVIVETVDANGNRSAVTLTV